MNILTFDLGTTTGWASYASGHVMSGTFKCRGANQSWGRGFCDFEFHVHGLLDDFRPDFVYFENVCRWSSGDAAKVYGGLRSILLMKCHTWGAPTVNVSPGAIKKCVTGNGRASKDDMIAWARDKYPDDEIKDDNQADALALLEYAIKDLKLNQN